MNKYTQMLFENNYAKEYGQKHFALIAQEEAFQTMLTHMAFKMGGHFVMEILGE